MKVHGRRKRNTVRVHKLNCPILIVGLPVLPIFSDCFQMESWCVHMNQQLASIMRLATLDFNFFLFFHCLSLYFYSFTSMPCPCFQHFSFLIYSFHFYLMLLFSNEAVRPSQSVQKYFEKPFLSFNMKSVFKGK